LIVSVTLDLAWLLVVRTASLILVNYACVLSLLLVGCATGMLLLRCYLLILGIGFLHNLG